MVKRVQAVTHLGRSGVAGWLIQRVSALVMLAYVIFLIGVFLTHTNIDYDTWKAIFGLTSVRIFTLLTLLALLGHAWTGMWTIFTDYLKCPYTRGTLQVLMILAFIALFFWGVQILWSL
jgi:succinate dehydrogenase / fumarate reductase, membrane anchor subunit